MEKEIKYEYTKTPLDYQITEYDCGTTTLLNALRYLFKRKVLKTRVDDNGTKDITLVHGDNREIILISRI